MSESGNGIGRVRAGVEMKQAVEVVGESANPCR